MYSSVQEETVMWNNYREALGTWITIKDIYEVLRSLSWNLDGTRTDDVKSLEL